MANTQKLLIAYKGLSLIHDKGLDLIGAISKELKSLQIEIKESDEPMNLDIINDRLNALIMKIAMDVREQKILTETLLESI